MLTDDNIRDIGIAVENLYREPFGKLTEELERLNVGSTIPLTARQQEEIMFWSGPSARIAGHMESRFQDGITLRHFLLKLRIVMKKMSDETLREEIMKKVDGASVVSFKANDGRRMIVHRATRTDATSEWQLSSIGYDGIPSGHENPPTFEEAVYRALGISEDGYWNWHGFEFEWSNLEREPAPC